MDTTNPIVNRLLYAFLCVLNLVISAALIEIGKGTIPFPSSLQWAVPLIVAGLTGVGLFLPRAGSEQIARQVNRLRAMGVPKSQMQVIDKGGVETPGD